MKIRNIFIEAAPGSSEKIEEYVDRLSHLAPSTMLQVNTDLEVMSKSSISSVIIKATLLLNELDKTKDFEILYMGFINHHLQWYENACWDCPNLFNPESI